MYLLPGSLMEKAALQHKTRKQVEGSSPSRVNKKINPFKKKGKKKDEW